MSVYIGWMKSSQLAVGSRFGVNLLGSCMHVFLWLFVYWCVLKSSIVCLMNAQMGCLVSLYSVVLPLVCALRCIVSILVYAQLQCSVASLYCVLRCATCGQHWQMRLTLVYGHFNTVSSVCSGALSCVCSGALPVGSAGG